MGGWGWDGGIGCVFNTHVQHKTCNTKHATLTYNTHGTLTQHIHNSDATFKEPLSLDEIKAGVGLLDKNKDGAIQFNEFVDWWVKRVEVPA